MGEYGFYGFTSLVVIHKAFASGNLPTLLPRPTRTSTVSGDMAPEHYTDEEHSTLLPQYLQRPGVTDLVWLNEKWGQKMSCPSEDSRASEGQQLPWSTAVGEASSYRMGISCVGLWTSDKLLRKWGLGCRLWRSVG